ncbi:MAG: hypothetical protein GX279_10855, partial [Clostridiaceae bacterium]|nr:hypothetical protein [Clostridiaceae bacterium]
MSRSKIIIPAAAAVVLLALGTAVFYFGFIYDAAKPLSYISPGDTSKEEKHLSPNEGQQAEPKPEIEIFDPAYFIPELGRTYKYTFTDDGERHEIFVEWSKDDGVYKEYSDYPSFYFFRKTGGNPPHFNGEMKARFLQETLPLYMMLLSSHKRYHYMLI